MDNKLEQIGELVIKLHMHLEDTEKLDQKSDGIITKILILQRDLEDEKTLEIY